MMFFFTFVVAIVGAPTILFLALRSFRQGQRLSAWKQVTLACLISALPVLFFIYGSMLLKDIVNQKLEEMSSYMHAEPRLKP